MFYVRLALMFCWTFIASLVGMVYALIRPNDPNLFGRATRIASWGVLRISRTKVVLERDEIVKNSQPCVYVGNHQSALDVFIFAEIMPQKTTVVAKSELRYLPIIGWWFWAVGGTFIHRSKRLEAIKELEALAKRISETGLCVAMMPEGTRNKMGKGLLPFKKGPFHLAILAQVPVVPVVSSPLEKIANYAQKRIDGGIVRVRAYEPIPTKGMTPNDVDVLMERVRKVMLEGLAEVGHVD